MARRQMIVGDEESAKETLRTILAQRLTTVKPELRDKPFSINLMDVPPYPELNDGSREKLVTILDGYYGASTVWKGVKLPNYHYARSGNPHHIDVKYVKGAIPTKVDTRQAAPQR